MSDTKFGITYRKTFDDFLDTITDPDRRDMIEREIILFASGKADLDPKDCEHIKDRVKIGILNANVVVYFDNKGNDLEFISGLEIAMRVA